MRISYFSYMHNTAILFVLLLTCHAGYTQSFKLMRFDEDYTYLRDSASSFYQQLKYTSLSPKSDAYVSFGGSVRLEYVDFNNEDWGRLGIGHNNFLLQRYDLHADVHLGEKIRLFTQIRSAWEGGRKNGPRPIDEDHLNIQNLFIDAQLYKSNAKSLAIRVGRQELDYGSGRLISVREGPNLRLYFDGVKLMYAAPGFTVDALVMMADTVNTGAFDNKVSKQVNLWGIYAKRIFREAGNLDFYYLGIRRDAAVFEEGTANERRHTVGGRYWKYGGGFIYNFEAAWQFGKFGNRNIGAWTASADIGYLFESLKVKPSVNLRNDYISGDAAKGDGKLGTFNPIYPKGGYFGFSPQIGPVNLIDIHPYATINPAPKLLLQADVVFNWRYSLQDGIYRPSGNFNLAGAASKKRYIGTAYLASAVYTVNKFISLNTGIQYFKTGGFIDDLINDSKDGVFINTRIAIKF